MTYLQLWYDGLEAQAKLIKNIISTSGLSETRGGEVRQRIHAYLSRRLLTESTHTTTTWPVRRSFNELCKKTSCDKRFAFPANARCEKTGHAFEVVSGVKGGTDGEQKKGA